MDALKARGLYDNSVILFTTDNGGPANGFNINMACNFPLREAKATLWEGDPCEMNFQNSWNFEQFLEILNYLQLC